jgi:hypothetical protein
MNGLSLADHIFVERAPAAKPEWIADVLARLVWLTGDNGAGICHTLRQWLAGRNEEKAAVALAFDEVFLWNTEVEMENLLSSVETQFTNLTSMCAGARSRWRAQFGGA